MHEIDLRGTLCLVTDRTSGRPEDYIATIEAAIEGGATMVQLREKLPGGAAAVPDRRFFEEGLVLRELCRRRGVLFVVDDRLDLAMALDADGLHVGQDDLPVAVARRLWPEGRLFGVSAPTLEHALRAREEGADYVGTGAVYATATKPEATLSGMAELARMARDCGLPVIAIGGIGPDETGPVMAAGCAGIAVVSAVWKSPDPRKAAAELRRLVDENLRPAPDRPDPRGGPR